MNKSKSVKKIVLAYSGGLDTSVIMKWLKETYKAQIIAYVADLGQGEDMDEISRKAKRTGANKVYVEDLRNDLVKDYFFPMLKANALYEGMYYLGTSIARPLIAKKQMDIAKKEKADAVSHGATGKGNDQVRFELTYYAFDPSITVISPWREWTFAGRTELMAYAKKHGIPVPTTTKKPYSSDANLVHISYESGILEDPWLEPPEDIFQMTVSPEAAPDKPTEITVEFKKGEPVAVNGKKMGPAKLLDHLNKIGGKNGIGRVDMVENRYVGMKNRGVYETPGGTILYTAHRALENITVDREVYFLKDSLMPQYARLVYNGYWFSPEREALQVLIDKSQEKVSGTIRLKLYKGNCIITGRKSPNSLYSLEYATMEKDTVYDQADAEGFIKLNALRLKINKMLGKG